MHLKTDYKYCLDESKVINNYGEEEKKYTGQWQQGS